MGKHAVLLLCVLSATTMARPVASSRSAWVGASATAVVTTNAPVLRWSSQVESTGTSPTPLALAQPPGMIFRTPQLILRQHHHYMQPLQM